MKFRIYGVSEGPEGPAGGGALAELGRDLGPNRRGGMRFVSAKELNGLTRPPSGTDSFHMVDESDLNACAVSAIIADEFRSFW